MVSLGEFPSARTVLSRCVAAAAAAAASAATQRFQLGKLQVGSQGSVSVGLSVL